MAGPQTGYCHLKGHLHNWGHMGHFYARPFCIIFHSTPSLTSIFSILLIGLLVSRLPFFGARSDYLHRLLLTGITNLKMLQLFNVLLNGLMLYNWVTRWYSWLRKGATSQKVAGSIPEGVIGFFIDIILPAALMLQNAFKVSNGSFPLKHSLSRPLCCHLDSADRAVAPCYPSRYVPVLYHLRRSPNIYVQRPYTYSFQQMSFSMFTIYAGGGEFFRTSPGRPWGTPNLLYNGHRVFSGGKAAVTWR